MGAALVYHTQICTVYTVKSILQFIYIGTALVYIVLYTSCYIYTQTHTHTHTQVQIWYTSIFHIYMDRYMLYIYGTALVCIILCMHVCMYA
jgi:hypothetical protein